MPSSEVVRACKNFKKFQSLLRHHKNGLAVREFPNGSGDLGSIPGRVLPKT